MQTITLTLNKPLIIEAVKNETYRRSQFDKSADEKATNVAFQEAAGDDLYHERTILRGIYTAVEDLKSLLSDYLSYSANSTADNNISSTESGDNIVISLVVGSRFNGNYAQSLARLASKYVEESVLVDWWKAVNERQAAIYQTYIEKDLAGIRRCFNKVAPSVPTIPYTTTIDLSDDDLEIAIDEEATVTYTLDSNVIDDIEVVCDDTEVCDVYRSATGTYTILGKTVGEANVQFYSHHDETIAVTLEVTVTEE